VTKAQRAGTGARKCSKNGEKKSADGGFLRRGALRICDENGNRPPRTPRDAKSAKEEWIESFLAFLAVVFVLELSAELLVN
jgi:hypothetical protein